MKFFLPSTIWQRAFSAGLLSRGQFWIIEERRQPFPVVDHVGQGLTHFGFRQVGLTFSSRINGLDNGSQRRRRCLAV